MGHEISIAKLPRNVKKSMAMFPASYFLYIRTFGSTLWYQRTVALISKCEEAFADELLDKVNAVTPWACFQRPGEWVGGNHTSAPQRVFLSRAQIKAEQARFSNFACSD